MPGYVTKSSTAPSIVERALDVPHAASSPIRAAVAARAAADGTTADATADDAATVVVVPVHADVEINGAGVGVWVVALGAAVAVVVLSRGTTSVTVRGRRDVGGLVVVVFVMLNGAAVVGRGTAMDTVSEYSSMMRPWVGLRRRFGAGRRGKVAVRLPS